MNKYDSMWMDEAIKEALKAKKNDEVPVGAVIIFKNKIISRAHNRVEELKDPTAHAEILALRIACRKLNTYYLNECKMFVTLEPCAMCLKAISLSKIKKIYFGAYSFESGAIFHKESMVQSDQNFDMKVVGGFKETSCSGLLKAFFVAKRG